MNYKKVKEIVDCTLQEYIFSCFIFVGEDVGNAYIFTYKSEDIYNKKKTQVDKIYKENLKIAKEYRELDVIKDIVSLLKKQTNLLGNEEPLTKEQLASYIAKILKKIASGGYEDDVLDSGVIALMNLYLTKLCVDEEESPQEVMNRRVLHAYPLTNGVCAACNREDYIPVGFKKICSHCGSIIDTTNIMNPIVYINKEEYFKKLSNVKNEDKIRELDKKIKGG